MNAWAHILTQAYLLFSTFILPAMCTYHFIKSNTRILSLEKDFSDNSFFKWNLSRFTVTP